MNKIYNTLLNIMLGFGLMLLLGCSESRQNKKQKPNLILIVTDDQGYSDAGFKGSAIQTPNLDRMVKEGVLLNRFYTCPVCSPTRAGLLTGRYPIRFGMQRAVNRPFSPIGIPTCIKTLPELLGEAGYEHRHMVGKWHLGNMRWEHLPLRQGFTSQYGPYNSGIDYFAHTRWEQHDWHRNDTTVYEDGYATDLLSDEVVRLINQHEDSKDPFFVYLAHTAPHAPLMAPEEETQKYDSLGKKRATYAAMVSIIDQGLGRIMNALEETGQDNNTLLVFMSDNGGSFIASDNSPLRGAKSTLYEGGIRVLATARWPGHIPAGTIIDEPCSYIDILPTFLSAAGESVLTENTGLDGRNVLPLWQGKEWEADSWQFFSFYEKNRKQGRIEELSLIRQNMKLIRRGRPILESSDPLEDAEVELYNLKKDQSETKNLASEQTKLVSELLDTLLEYRKLRSATGVPPMVEPVPEWWKPPENWDLKRPGEPVEEGCN